MYKNRSLKVVSEQQLIAGLAKHLGKTPVVIAGVSYTSKQLVGILRARIEADQAGNVARAAWLSVIEKERAQNAATKEVVSGLRKVLAVMFGGSLEALADFGMAPPKRGTMTAEAQAAKVEKARATRARNTKGAPPAPLAPPAAAAPPTPPAATSG